ncbi:DUF4917 family protein [Catellatospora chokoriensis]|uniref:DUF4917 family protein n=1 Tax=Catellatospora chokoriensis TaxID=310353 RepID=UPI0017813153|nr:DUF4917 family protein [Catellatospora chokoriensis]
MGSADQVLRFSDALAESRGRANECSLFLGNGFSMAWDRDIFGYQSLFDEADLRDLTVGKEPLFNAFGTHDFETIIEHLHVAEKLAEVYKLSDADFRRNLGNDANVIRTALPRVLAKRHPDSATRVNATQYGFARRFLSEFANIFTVNYDLLLYWAIVDAAGLATYRDGFRNADDGSGLIWHSPDAAKDQNVFYLHGALHLYAKFHELWKLRYAPGQLLVDQIRRNLEANVYPLVVTEGKSEEKLHRISQSPYLKYCYDRLRDLNGSLFIYGFSFSEADKHVIDLLDNNPQLIELYISVYGSPGGDGYDNPLRAGERIEARSRANGLSLRVRYFDAQTAQVWAI